jgi:NCAIR mutase (PurE)-related protein
MGEAQLPWATLDLDREARTGTPEAVWAEGKSPEQVAEALGILEARGQVAIATRVDAAAAEAVLARLPSATFHAVARVLVAGPPRAQVGRVAVVSAGSTDAPVAEEAAVVLGALGNVVHRVVDVGVAGIGRLLRRVDELRECRAVVVVAGVDGALPGVVAGLVAAPVIAVPTSNGYGTGLGGLAAMLTMLNACAPGVTVVNIDNGYGAAVAASRINRGA